MYTSSPPHPSPHPPCLQRDFMCLESELKREMQLKFTIKLNILQDTSTSVKLLLSPMLIDHQSADYLDVSPP